MQTTTSLLLLLVAVVHTVAGGVAPRKVSGVNGRIINGVNATVGEFPSQINLEKTRFPACGGSILNEYWALTAAHCVVDLDEYDFLEILAGTIVLNVGGTWHTVESIIVHPEYNRTNSVVNDIAVVRVSTPFPLNGETVAPVKLPEQGQDTPAGSRVTVIGWGDDKFGGNPSNFLKKVDIEVWSQDLCNSLFYEGFGRPIYPTQICAAGVDEPGAACNGDSGGPLFHEGVIVGMVSWSYECATPPYPNVFTRVSSYVEWINQQINA